MKYVGLDLVIKFHWIAWDNKITSDAIELHWMISAWNSICSNWIAHDGNTWIDWFYWTCRILHDNRHSTGANKNRSATHWDTERSNKTCLSNMESKPLGNVSYLNTDLIHNLVKLFPIRSALTLPVYGLYCSVLWYVPLYGTMVSLSVYRIFLASGTINLTFPATHNIICWKAFGW